MHVCVAQAWNSVIQQPEQSTFGALFETEEYESGDSEADMQEDIMRADFDGE